MSKKPFVGLQPKPLPDDVVVSDFSSSDPVDAAVAAMEGSGAFDNGVFLVDRATIRSCFLAGLDAYFAALDDGTSKANEDIGK